MADFCNICINGVFPGELPDIDIIKLSEKLEENTYISGFLCEGCGITSITKINNKILALFYKDIENLEDDVDILSLYKEIKLENYE